MADDIQINLKHDGFKELAEALAKAPFSVQRRSLPRILREAAKDLMGHVDNNIDMMLTERSGRTKRALQMAKRRGARDIFTGEQANDPIYDVFINKGESQKDQNGAWYAHFVEWGHALEGGGTVAGRPFMGNAFRDHGDRLLSEALEKLEKAIVNSLRQAK